MYSWWLVTTWNSGLYRSSDPEVFCKRGVLRNFAKFTGNHLCQRLVFNKVAVLRLRPATLLRKSLWHRCFLANFVKFLRAFFFTEHLRWLLLVVYCASLSFTSIIFDVFKYILLRNSCNTYLFFLSIILSQVRLISSKISALLAIYC